MNALLTTPNRPTVLVFGDSSRAPRTTRILRFVDCRVEALDDLSSDLLTARLLSGPVWLIRAGCWPVFLRTLTFPRSSDTGRPLCALGAVRARLGTPTDADAEQWSALQRECGGDFAHLDRLSDRLPPLASVYLDAAAARVLSARLAAKRDLQAALRILLDPSTFRIVRVPAAVPLPAESSSTV